MTIQQETLNVINTLSDEQVSQVLLFAQFLQTGVVLSKKSKYTFAGQDGYIRKPGVLKRKMVMADDFDETPECFKEYV